MKVSRDIRPFPLSASIPIPCEFTASVGKHGSIRFQNHFNLVSIVRWSVQNMPFGFSAGADSEGYYPFLSGAVGQRCGRRLGATKLQYSSAYPAMGFHSARHCIGVAKPWRTKKPVLTTDSLRCTTDIGLHYPSVTSSTFPASHTPNSPLRPLHFAAITIAISALPIGARVQKHSLLMRQQLLHQACRSSLPPLWGQARLPPGRSATMPHNQTT